MKIPKSLKVGAFKFEVIQEDELNEEDSSGLFSLTEERIYLKKSTGVKHKEQVMMHEILHAIDEIYNAGRLDEDTTERLSHGLLQVFTDLKWLGE